MSALSGNTTSSTEDAGGLLPAFNTKQYSHLPTPQSPNDLGRYVHDGPYSPESPVPYGAPALDLQSQRDGNRKLNLERFGNVESTRVDLQSMSHRYVTPDSSPHISHGSHSYYHNPATPRYLIPPHDVSTPRQSFHVKLESTLSISNVDPEHSISTPSSSSQPSHSSALSSPFMARMSVTDHSKPSLPLQPSEVAEASSSPRSTQAAGSAMPTPISPTSFPQQSNSNSMPGTGGELERIRQAMMEDRLAQIHDAEKRRPDYLKRSKRPMLEADPGYPADKEVPNDVDRPLAVGVMESPHKGRRLKLFQETSEESFEESLMAGGYGRYRTADWVRQPQPISLPVSTTAGSSVVVSLLEEAEEAPLSEREAKKRRRLAAFKIEITQSNSKLCAVELDGKGRVLIDVPAEEQHGPESPEPSPNKKRVSNRRRRKGLDVAGKKLSGISRDAEEQADKPNWPDTEFPWRLRTEERIELAKAEEEERMRWIERFLDRDSDDESESESMQHEHDATRQYDDITRQLKLDLPSDSEKRRPFAIGRGKMVPLPVYIDGTENVPRHVVFPSDPADAKAALLSKKSVRALSYRQRKRQRELDDEDDDEVVCICNGKDDGRELVQCDACQTWYHLQCIGIKNIAELGREEDPWFCRRCARRSSPHMELVDLASSEPTLVPTDDPPNDRRPLEASFFPPSLQESPNWVTSNMPRTPTRHSNFSYSWSDSSRPGPSTPQHSSQSVQVYSSPFDINHQNYEESPFDPTSTPSRGIKFHVPFATPKATNWLPRANTSLFHTPSNSIGRRPSGPTTAAILGSHLPALDHDTLPNTTSMQDHFDRVIAYDESPIRRNRAADSSNPHHIFHSPSRSKTSGPNWSLLQESPVVRSLDSPVQSERSRSRVALDADLRYHERVP